MGRLRALTPPPKLRKATARNPTVRNPTARGKCHQEQRRRQPELRRPVRLRADTVELMLRADLRG